MKAVTIRVNDVEGVAGFVLPGDRVDVVLTRHRREEQRGQRRRAPERARAGCRSARRPDAPRSRPWSRRSRSKSIRPKGRRSRSRPPSARCRFCCARPARSPVPITRRVTTRDLMTAPAQESRFRHHRRHAAVQGRARRIHRAGGGGRRAFRRALQSSCRRATEKLECVKRSGWDFRFWGQRERRGGRRE